MGTGLLDILLVFIPRTGYFGFAAGRIGQDIRFVWVWIWEQDFGVLRPIGFFI